MDKRTYREQVKRLKEVLRRWVDPLQINEWGEVEFVFGHKPVDDRGEALAETKTQWQYRTAKVTFYMAAVEEASDKYLEYAVVHELLHIHIAEALEKGIKHEERVVTTLAKAIQNVREWDK